VHIVDIHNIEPSDYRTFGLSCRPRRWMYRVVADLDADSSFSWFFIHSPHHPFVTACIHLVTAIHSDGQTTPNILQVHVNY